MTHREGRADVIGTIWLPSLHKGITEEMLTTVLDLTSGNRVVSVQIFRRTLEDEGDNASQRTNYARIDLDGLKAKDKVLQKCEKGSVVVVVSGQPFYIQAVNNFSQPRVNSETTVHHIASAMTTCLTLEEDKVEVFQRVQRDNQLPISFDFKQGTISFAFADARRNGLVYKFLVFIRELVKIRFWADPQNPNDALMMLQVSKRPYVWFTNTQALPTPPVPMDPFRNFSISSPDDKGVIFSSDTLVRLLQDEPERFTRLSTGAFYEDAMYNPLQMCDSFVFRFKDRAKKLGTWPLLRLLLEKCPTLLSRKFQTGHSWAQFATPFRNVIRKKPEVVFQDFFDLPVATKWGVMNLVTNDLMSPRGFLEEINSPMRSALARANDDENVVACALESMSTAAGWYRIADSTLEKQFKTHMAASSVYGGPAWNHKHGFMVPNLIVTPSRVIASTLQVSESNRMLRHFAPQLPNGALLRVRFLDEGFRPLHGGGKEGGYMLLFMQHILASGLRLFGQIFEFVFFSQSQLRETSCWMLHRSSSHSITPEHIRQWLGDIGSYSFPSTCASRLGLSLSQTSQGYDNLEEDEIGVEGDIMTKCRSYNFTDGCGKISAELMESIALRLELDQVPSALQIRFRGSKGMLVQAPLPSGKKVMLRESMIKCRREGPAALEICGSSCYRPAYINREIINLLWSLHVDEHVFYRLQHSFIEDLRLLVVDSTSAANMLRRQYLSGGESRWQAEVAAMLTAGLPVTEPFIKATLQTIRALHLKEIRCKARVLVKSGALLYGVADPIGVLKPDEVVVTLHRPGIVPGKWDFEPIKGRVVVTRNPCLHPGDIRVAKAVEAPAGLDHLVNVIVFPTEGTRPLPSQMSGGDLDGDQFSVYWDKRLIPKDKDLVRSLPYISPSREPGHACSVEDLIDLFTAFPLHDSVGVISNAHKAWASINASERGAASEECLELAQLAAISVDYVKTGISARMRPQLRRETMPEFMENKTKPVIKTTCPLANLWHMVMSMDEEVPGRQATPLHVDERFIADGHERYLENAHETYQKYRTELSATMAHYGLSSDAAAISGTATGLRDDLAHDRNLADKLQRRIRQIRDKYSNIFWDSGGDDEEFELEEQIRKLSSWYRVAYEQDDQAFRSFAWIVPEVMMAKGGLIDKGFTAQIPEVGQEASKDATADAVTGQDGGGRQQGVGAKKKKKQKGKTIVLAGMRR